MPHQNQCFAGIGRCAASRRLTDKVRSPSETIANAAWRAESGLLRETPNRETDLPKDGPTPTSRLWKSLTAPGTPLLSLTAAIRQWTRLSAVLAGMWVGAAEAGDRYLRLGVGFDLSNETAFMDLNCRSVAPNALYGCGRDPTGAPRRSLGDFGTPAVLEFGLGHDTGSTMRYELLFEYRPRFKFKGNANFVASLPEEPVRAKLSSVSAMLAAFVDLDRSNSAYSPFIGFGIGMARTKVGTTTMTFRSTKTIVPGNTSSDLAWMVTAGFGVALDERTTLDVAWRYTDLGRVRTGTGSGQVVWLNGSRDPIPLNLAPTQARLTSHGLRISVRRPF